MPDAVRDGETGVLVDSEDPAGVAHAIAALLDDPNRRAALGAAGRRGVESFYNWTRVMDDLRAISLEASAAPP